MKHLPIVALVLLCASGCVTMRDKVAVVRGAKFAATEGSELGQVVSEELSEVAVDIGADKIPPETVPLSVEAARENAAGIRRERSARQAVWSLLGKGASWLGQSVPWLAPVLGFGAAAVEWLRRRRAQAEALASSEIVGVLARGAEKLKAGGNLAEIIKEEVRSTVHVDAHDIQAAVDRGQAGSI